MDDAKPADPYLNKLITDAGEVADAAHDLWFRSQVKATLAKKARGEMDYIPLDVVAKEFGL